MKRNFSEWSRVYIQGNVIETLVELDSEMVLLLHIDMDHYKVEVFALRTLWNRIPRGGLVFLNDYAVAGYEWQYQAMNKLAEELHFDVLSTPTGQGIIIK